jgi:3-oxoacyl-[acyl-carrier-protein] synthase-3
MNNALVIGCGHYLPQKVVSNDDIAKLVDTSDDWIRERTGITQRHIAATGELTSDLATAAAKEALARAGLPSQAVDLIVLATTTPDDTFPATALMVQHKLGATQAAAFDVQAVCSGFIYALAIANNFLRAGQAKTALVIGADVMSRLLDWHDRKSCILFGDGAGAVVLRTTADQDRGVLSTHLYSDGSLRDILYVSGGVGSSTPECRQIGTIQIQGREVFRHAVPKMAQAVTDGLTVHGLTVADINWLVPHQANQRIVEALALRLHLPPQKVISCVAKHANTSAGTIPLALATSCSLFTEGDLVVLTAFGGGLTWGSALIRW